MVRAKETVVRIVVGVENASQNEIAVESLVDHVRWVRESPVPRNADGSSRNLRVFGSWEVTTSSARGARSP